MAVGLPLKTTYADGDVYSASDVNDTNGTINITAAPFAAGKNKIINGDFYVNQRNFSSSTSYGYGFDRFINAVGGGTGTATFTAQTFTPGAAPVSGYEGKNFLRCVTTGQSAAGTYTIIQQQIEDVRTLAGQTATISFWAKAATGTPKMFVEFEQTFGTGGSASVQIGSQITLSTSWARYSVTIAVPSVSGKTIAANDSALGLLIWLSAGTTFNSRTSSLGIQSNTFEIWGVQVENGSTATAFQTATGTIQGELALCQRYYQNIFPNGSFLPLGYVGAFATSYGAGSFLPVVMRAAPTLTYTDAVGNSNRASTYASSGARVDNLTPSVVINNAIEFSFSVGGNYTLFVFGSLTASAEL